MVDFTDYATAVKALSDSATSATDLAAITGAQPSLWGKVALHPNAYPQLLGWLESVGDESVKQAVRVARGEIPSPPLPPPPVPQVSTEVASVEVSPVEQPTPAMPEVNSPDQPDVNPPDQPDVNPPDQPEPTPVSPPPDLAAAAPTGVSEVVADEQPTPAEPVGGTTPPASLNPLPALPQMPTVYEPQQNYGQQPMYPQPPEYGQQPGYGQPPDYGQQYGYGQQPQSPYPSSGQEPYPKYFNEFEPEKPKVKVGLIVGIAIAVLVAAGIGIGAFWYLNQNPKPVELPPAKILTIDQFLTLADSTLEQATGVAVTKVTVEPENKSCKEQGSLTSQASGQMDQGSILLFADESDADKWLDGRKSCWESNGNSFINNNNEVMNGVRLVTLESAKETYYFIRYSNVAVYIYGKDAEPIDQFTKKFKGAVAEASDS
ncbi:MAG: hypothetical protein FWG47_03100 [Propionibacteriaceae bacterium]|nr:hypothetical protein [Propionibacteriaceae bacterium]